MHRNIKPIEIKKKKKKKKKGANINKYCTIRLLSLLVSLPLPSLFPPSLIHRATLPSVSALERRSNFGFRSLFLLLMTCDHPFASQQCYSNYHVPPRKSSLHRHHHQRQNFKVQ